MTVKPQLSVIVDKELKRRLKRYCFEQDKKQYLVVDLALDEYLTKHGYSKEPEEK